MQHYIQVLDLTAFNVTADLHSECQTKMPTLRLKRYHGKVEAIGGQIVDGEFIIVFTISTIAETSGRPAILCLSCNYSKTLLDWLTSIIVSKLEVVSQQKLSDCMSEQCCELENCDGHPHAQCWSFASLLEEKHTFEVVLEQSFADDYFTQHITCLYRRLREKVKEITESRCNGNDWITDGKLANLLNLHFDPVAIGYFVFAGRFNNYYRSIPFHQCDHSATNIDFIQELVRKAKFHVKYRSKRHSQLLLQRDQSVARISCHLGCCAECAELATPGVVRCVYALCRNEDTNTDHELNFGQLLTEEGLLPFDIDNMCLICIWLSNIMQHPFVKVEMSSNLDFMPTIFLTLFRLMRSAHGLRRKFPTHYRNRWNVISFAIWRLSTAIIMNYHFIGKYCFCPPRDKEGTCFCEAYAENMMRWLMQDLLILSELLKDNQELCLQYDYFGCLAILLSQFSLEALNEVRSATCSSKLMEDPPLRVWLLIHNICHGNQII